MLQFHCVAPSEQSCDLSTDQGERANIEHPSAAGHLEDSVSPSNKLQEDDERFAKSTSFAVCLMT
jgi:hypothetical protein